MDIVWVALGTAISLVVALAWAIWWLVANARRDRRRQPLAHTRPAHRFRGQGEAVTVAELLREARERG